MSYGNPNFGLLKDMIDLMNELGPHRSFSSTEITSLLTDKGQWSDGSAKTPDRNVNAYFSQNPNVFIRNGRNSYSLQPQYISARQTSYRDGILLKEVGKSQYKDGVRIDQAFHGIFNPPGSTSYTERGTARQVKVTFNSKDFDAEYRFEGTKAKERDLQRIGFHAPLIEEFKRIFPQRKGLFTIKLGSNPNHFIFDCNISSDLYNKRLEEGISKSRRDSRDARQLRLAEAVRTPVSVQVTSCAFIRNPDVIVEVLERAGGKCEACFQDAPFLRAKDNTPYLEVHHTMPLSEGGDDVVVNAIALCPNCHRKMHYGLNV